MCRKRKASSPGNVERSGRTSSFRTRARISRAPLLEPSQRAGVKDLALHRRSLEDGALSRRKPVDPRSEQRLDRGWNGNFLQAGGGPLAVFAGQEALSEEQSDGLLDEQGIPFRDLHDLSSNALLERSWAEVRRDE